VQSSGFRGRRPHPHQVRFDDDTLCVGLKRMNR
jgi:hypothetical protein